MNDLQEQQEIPTVPEEKKPHLSSPVRKKKRNIALRFFIVFLSLLFGVFIGITAFLLSGKYSLLRRTQGAVPNLADPETEGISSAEAPSSSNSAHVWKEGWVRYNDKIYEYNDDIMTFLIMGIDKKTPVEAAKTPTDGGQADGLFLLVANPDDKSVKVIAVNRDTMVDVWMYGFEKDGITPVIQAQITVQHGFGDGMEQSCEATVDAVSKLFYDLPISGYAAINMGAISDLVWVVDGIDVSVLEDMTKLCPDWKEGAFVHLYDSSAYDYVHYRNTDVYESARLRLARQKQFLSLYIAKLKERVKQDITLPIQVYQMIDKYMVTNVSADQAAYLATQLVDYSFDGENIYTLEGTTVTGEEYEEFYPDKDALKDLMIQIFYQEVDPQELTSAP